MQKLLNWLLASPFRVGAAATALALTRILDLFAAGLVSCLALRGGAAAALSALTVAVPILWLAGAWAGVGPVLLLFEMALWLPVIGVSLVLRRTGSLALMMQSAAALLGLGVIAWYLAEPAPMDTLTGIVAEQLVPLFSELTDGAMVLEPEQQREFARVLPASVSIGVLAVIVVSVLLGRYWQAVAVNPGGFRRDFHEIRQGRSLAILALLLWIVTMLTDHLLAIALACLASGILVFQGIAVAHGVVARRGKGGGWLWAMHGALLLLPMQACTLLMVLGAMDNWIDWRRHVGRSGDA